jgi:meso-butanediol dehydrogenase / (S,S)-butanediol dehydrogenase / diacetyl reductase
VRLAGKIALVTGAGAGIGQEIARRFAREGAKVVVVDRDEASGRATADSIREAGGTALFVQADLAQAADVQAMFAQTKQHFGGLNILCNIAGTVAQGKVEETSEEEWAFQIGTTLTSVFLGCKYGIPLLRESGGGVIVNMASVAGIMGIVNRAVYSAAKGGVIALTRAMALDYAPEGIRVNCISPATVETPSLRDRINSSPDPAAARKAFEARQPIGRLGTPEDIAAAALYLASDDGSFITGTNLVIDGGMSV